MFENGLVSLHYFLDKRSSFLLIGENFIVCFVMPGEIQIPLLIETRFSIGNGT